MVGLGGGLKTVHEDHIEISPNANEHPAHRSQAIMRIQ